MDNQRIEREIARISQERDDFLRWAERQAAAHEGAIKALEHLLQPEPAEPATTDNPL